MKFGFTQTIYAIATHSDDPNNPTEYGTEQLQDLSKDSSKDSQVPIQFDVYKLHKSNSGDIQTVTGANPGLMTLLPVGGPFASQDGSSILQWCWTADDVVQPGGDIVCTLTDEFGTVQMDGTNEKKEAVTTGIKKRSLVLILFKEGDQNGEVVLAITKEWGVIFAPKQEDNPFAGASNFRPSLWGLLMRILPALPAAMAGTVADATISQVP